MKLCPRCGLTMESNGIGSVDASHVSLILVLRIPEQIGITDYCNDLRHQRCSKGCRKLEGH